VQGIIPVSCGEVQPDAGGKAVWGAQKQSSGLTHERPGLDFAPGAKRASIHSLPRGYRIPPKHGRCCATATRSRSGPGPST